MSGLKLGILLASTATVRCADSVEAALPRDTFLSVHRLSGAESPDSLAELARDSGSTVIVAGRGLRAWEVLRATADSAIRAGRPCLFLYHAGGVTDLSTLPARCEAHPYKTSRAAASRAAAFVTRNRASTLRVFVMNTAWSPRWNASVTASIQRAGALLIVPLAITADAFGTAAREADITIVMPGCRKDSLANDLARVACAACSKAGKRWLYIRSSLALTNPEYVAARPPGCELAVCARREDVAQAVNKFVDDAMTA